MSEIPLKWSFNINNKIIIGTELRKRREKQEKLLILLSCMTYKNLFMRSKFKYEQCPHTRSVSSDDPLVSASTESSLLLLEELINSLHPNPKS